MAVINTFRIPYKYGDVIRIKPIADVHMGNNHCDIKAFKKYLDDRDEHTYFLGLGDLHDSIITKDIKRYSKEDDATDGSDIIDQQIRMMTAFLKPIADEGRLIGLADGNHENAILKYHGTHPTKRQCEALNVPYLGYSGMIRLLLREKTGRGRKVMIFYHHGYGGGSRTQGADLTKYSKHAAQYDADIYLYGHVHRKQSDEISRLGASGEKWLNRPRHLAICGTYLRTLSRTTFATYAEIAGYPPTAIGGVVCNIKPVDRWVKIWIDT